MTTCGITVEVTEQEVRATVDNDSINVTEQQSVNIVPDEACDVVVRDVTTEYRVIVDEGDTVILNNDRYIIVADGCIGPPGPPGPPGPGGGSLISGIAGEAISALRVVSMTPSGVVYFDATDINDYGKVVGISTTAGGVGATINIQTIGPLNSPGWGLTPGERYFANANGTISTTPSSPVVVPVGYAIDVDTLNVQIGTYLEVV